MLKKKKRKKTLLKVEVPDGEETWRDGGMEEYSDKMEDKEKKDIK